MQDAALLADFASMYRNTLSYKTTRNVRPSTVEMALECEVIAITIAIAISRE